MEPTRAEARGSLPVRYVGPTRPAGRLGRNTERPLPVRGLPAPASRNGGAGEDRGFVAANV